MSAWLLPDHIADVLPPEARQIERLRRKLLDTAQGYGYELVMPPLVEHIESLLTGTGEALNLQTFKLVDQLSGRTLGVRADTTAQVARIDAHLLGRQGSARLCYCGPVLHTLPDGAHATREPLQFGAEIYGHQGRLADLEILQLALDCLHAAPLSGLTLDLADARIVRALLEGAAAPDAVVADIHAALGAKDAAALRRLCAGFAPSVREALLALTSLYGDVQVLAEAARHLPDAPAVRDALAHLQWLAGHVAQAWPQVAVGVDLADGRGWGYYSGMRFAVYAQGAGAAVLRGGRYDGVGAVFGHGHDRNRPAVGFSLDAKRLADLLPEAAPRAAIRAPWVDDAGLHAAIGRLRAQGETVLCLPQGQPPEVQTFVCTRELALSGGQWVVQPTENADARTANAAQPNPSIQPIGQTQLPPGGG